MATPPPMTPSQLSQAIGYPKRPSGPLDPPPTLPVHGTAWHSGTACNSISVHEALAISPSGSGHGHGDVQILDDVCI